MIYITTTDKLKEFPKYFTTVIIGDKAPDWYGGTQYRQVAAEFNFCNLPLQTYKEPLYAKCTNDKVSAILTAEGVIDDIVKATGKGNAAIVCEFPDFPFHKDELASRLSKYGMTVAY